MSTAFAILLFVTVYGPIAYLIYRDVTAQRTRVRVRKAPSAQPHSARRLLAGRALRTP